MYPKTWSEQSVTDRQAQPHVLRRRRRTPVAQPEVPVRGGD